LEPPTITSLLGRQEVHTNSKSRDNKWYCTWKMNLPKLKHQSPFMVMIKEGTQGLPWLFHHINISPQKGREGCCQGEGRKKRKTNISMFWTIPRGEVANNLSKQR
jgi:hypothetical protein